MAVIKIYRSILSLINSVGSAFRIIHFRLLYPGLYIDFKSYLAPNVKIKCYDGGVLRIINSNILDGSQIIVGHDGVAEISDTFIGYNCVITCKERLIIKSNCQIAEMVVIRDQEHNFGTPGLTIAEQGFKTSPICIGENVWLASKVTVLKGVEIGDNAVVGASSLVKSNIEPGSVYVGIPARRIK